MCVNCETAVCVYPCTAAGRDVYHAMSEGQHGTVHSIYAKALYLAMGPNQLILCCGEAYGSIPFGVALPDTALARIRERLRVGMEVCFEADGLVFPTANLQLTVPKAAVPQRQEPLRWGEKACCWKQAQALLLQRRKNVGLTNLASDLPNGNMIGKDPLQLRAYRNFEKLLKNIAAEDPEKSRQALTGLLGLGAGLTPSADDILTGFFYCWTRQPGGGTFRADLCQKLGRLAWARTTSVSACYLTAAAQGAYFELLDRLLRATFGEYDLKSAIDNLLSVGSCSGGEMAAGLLLGCWFYQTQNHSAWSGIKKEKANVSSCM